MISTLGAIKTNTTPIFELGRDNADSQFRYQRIDSDWSHLRRNKPKGSFNK